MTLYHRQLIGKIQELASKFPFVTITGPRQSGKSTIAKMSFPDYQKVSLEDLDMRAFAQDDPRGFIKSYPGKVIIDEVQRVPSLLSYLQTYTDDIGSEGMYILTGSQNTLLMHALDQTLAGRTALTTLLPLSLAEMAGSDILPATADEQMFYGGYPRIFSKSIYPTDYFPGYINTYVERDIRMSLDIGNLDKFTKLIKLCAGRIGQLLNKSSLAVEVGVSVTTVEAWLSVLEAGYIIYFLKPFHENFSKRLTKSPKLYFYDTGLACSLLGITNPEQVATHYLRGGLFENLVLNELMKSYLNRGVQPSLWFWRDSAGNEIDIVDTTGNRLNLYEVKSGHTFSPDYFKGLSYWTKKIGHEPTSKAVIYAGDISTNRTEGAVISMTDFIKSAQ